MAVTDDITALYVSILGRQPDSAGLAAYIAAINAGAMLADVAAAITASLEAKIVAIYQRELGRVPELQAVRNDTAFLARGGSTADIAKNVAASFEARNAIKNLYELELGRYVAPGDYSGAADQQALANGSSLNALRSMIALSPEAQANLDAMFLAEIGRPAPAGPTAPFTQILLNGGGISDVKAAIANTPEIYNDLVNAYQMDAGTEPTAVEIAANVSELQSGFAIAVVLPEIAQLTTGSLITLPTSVYVYSVAYILPETIGVPAPSFVYGLNNNDALISTTGFIRANDMSRPIVSQTLDLYGFTDEITAFNTATDILQLQSTQASSFSSLNISSFSSYAQAGTNIALGSNNNIQIAGVSPLDLHAANFRFV